MREHLSLHTQLTAVQLSKKNNNKETCCSPYCRYFSVGMTRLELATTGPPDQHSKPTELHPVPFKAMQN